MRRASRGLALLLTLLLLPVLPALAGQISRDVPDWSSLTQAEWDELRARRERNIGRVLELPVRFFVSWSSAEYVQCLGDSDRMANLVEGELRRAGARPTQDFESVAGSFFTLNTVVGVQNGVTCVVAYHISWEPFSYLHPNTTGWSTGLQLLWGPRWDSPQRVRGIIREHVAELGDLLAAGLSRLAEDAAGR